MRYQRSWIWLLAMLLCAQAALAQLYSGSATGVVADPSNAVVPGAKITLLDEDKGMSTTVETDVAGRYLFRSVPPGNYRISVAAANFQAQVRPGIKIDINQNVTVNFNLALSSSTEVVSITAEAPLLATEDASTGQVVGRRLIDSLPLVSRDATSLAYLSPGVVSAYNGKIGTGDQGNNFISSGSRNATADVLMDGASTTNYEQNGGIQVISYTPSAESIEEFKVQTSNFSAEFGFGGSTVINMVTRSGTNAFHGSGYDYLRNQVLDANKFFANQAGNDLPPLRRNNFGGTIGGPIRKNTTFFFFDYDGLREKEGMTAAFGVPSAAERTGNFGELCGYAGGSFDSSGRCSVPDAQLWDPYSGTYDPNVGGAVRTAFVPFNNLATYRSAGNPRLAGTSQELPNRAGNLLDPVSLKMAQYYPAPNFNVGTPQYEYYRNWVGSGATSNSHNQWDLKIDHRFNDRTLFSGKFSRQNTFRHMWNCFGNAADPCTAGPTTGHAYLGALNVTHTFSPTMLLTVSYGYNRAAVLEAGGMGDYPDVDAVDTLGLPQYMKASGVIVMPSVSVGDAYSSAWGTSVGTWPWTYIKGGNDAHQLNGALSWIKGPHEIKFGGEGRLRRINYTIPGPTGGYFSYDRNWTAQSDWGIGGDAMASFFTGLAGYGTYEISEPTSTQSFQWGGFVQDNWKVKRNVTVNLGLRYDLTMPRTERFNRMNWVDPNVVSAIQVPGLGTLHGGEVFASPNQRTNYDAAYTNFQPRIGFAWNAREKTVVRGGYGVFFSVSQAGAAGKGGSGQQGYSQTTDVTSTYLGDGATPWSRLSDPFPGTGPTLPPGSSLGLLNDVGFAALGPVRTLKSVPYEQTWSFGIQQQFPANLLIEADYLGKKGTHLYFGGSGDINMLGAGIERYSPDQIAGLLSYVDNPFYGLITNPNSSLSQPQIQAYQLQRPFPQYTGFGGDPLPSANSSYHALQVRADKRMSSGLQFTVAYTFSKAIDDASSTSGNITWLGGGTSLQNPNNRSLERSVSLFDVTHILSLSHVYELPFGHGKRFGGNWNALVDGALGGWQFNGIWSFATGRPLTLGLENGHSLPTYGGQRPNLAGTTGRNTGSDWMRQYFADPGVFVAPADYAVGNAPRALSWIRTPGQANAELSLFKEFALTRIREGMHLQLRVEGINALNHPQFGGPNTSVGSDAFGQVSDQANDARQVQMAVKVYF